MSLYYDNLKLPMRPSMQHWMERHRKLLDRIYRARGFQDAESGTRAIVFGLVRSTPGQRQMARQERRLLLAIRTMRTIAERSGWVAALRAGLAGWAGYQQIANAAPAGDPTSHAPPLVGSLAVAPRAPASLLAC